MPLRGSGRGDSSRRSLQGVDEVDDLIGLISLMPGVVEQLPYAVEHRRAFRRSGHRDSSSSPELEEAFVTQLVQGPEDGVLVDTQDGGQVLGEWESVAGCCLAVGDGSAELGRHL